MHSSILKSKIISEFKYVDGHSDPWRLFYDGSLFRGIIEELSSPAADAGVTKVVGIEAKGFILGAAVAAHLGAGFVAIRKPGGLYPGPKIQRETQPDYRGNVPTLSLQRAAIAPSDRVIIVDDWLETGSQALAAIAMLKELGATFVGCSIITDQLTDATRTKIGPVWSIVTAGELAP